jgi:O-antigen/teichoic acid export membrane protein
MAPQALGVDTAVLSLISTAGIVAATGTGNSFTALLPVRGCDRQTRLADGYLIVGALATVLGVVAGTFASATLHLSVYTAFIWTTFGAVATAFYMLKDYALVALGGTTKLLGQNVGASIGKIALLVLLVSQVSHPAVLATVASSAVVAATSIVIVIPRLVAATAPEASATSDSGPTRRDLALFSVRDGSGSAMANGVFLVLPFLTTWIAGATQGAVLALALAFSLSLELVSAGVGTALTAGLSASPERLWDRGRQAWLVTQAIAVLAAVGLIAVGPLIMRILGSQYRELPVVPVLAILAAGSAARVAFVIWSSVVRAMSRTGAILIANGFGTAVAIPLIIWFTAQWGAIGAAIGLSVASTSTGIVGAIGLLTRGRTLFPPPQSA